MINQIIHATIAMLAVINPFVCGVILLQTQKESNKKALLKSSLRVMLTVLAILLVSAVSGRYVLHLFGISMDAFTIMGGIILAFIGFQMMLTRKDNDYTGKNSDSLSLLVMFAASPGTIAMVITLSSFHQTDGLPLNAIIGTIIAVLISLIVMAIMIYFGGKEKKFRGQGMVSKFMGLIVVSMGLQFMLEGIKNFFGL